MSPSFYLVGFGPAGGVGWAGGEVGGGGSEVGGALVAVGRPEAGFFE